MSKEAFEKINYSLVDQFWISSNAEIELCWIKGISGKPFSREMCIKINAVRKEKGMGKKRNNVLVSPVSFHFWLREGCHCSPLMMTLNDFVAL